jgi:amino acid permease
MSKLDDEKDVHQGGDVLPELVSPPAGEEAPHRGLQIRHLAMSALAGVIGTVSGQSIHR